MTTLDAIRQIRPATGLTMCDKVRLTHASLAVAAIFAIVALLGATLAVAEPRAATAKSFFLVASRSMPDPVFQQSVILMLPPDEPPLVAGVIINKPTDLTVGNLFKQPLPAENRNQKVYFGGPVDLTAPLLIIRTTRPPKPAIQLWTDVYAVADADSISDILKDPRYGNDTRLYLGRTQWVQEQLRGELLEGAWNVVPVRTDLIFERDSAKIWPMLSQHEHVREIDTRCFGTSSGMLASTMCDGAFVW
ncbi:MAG: YqgE/AlgH family protein [Deltaproteobacteria bacterium]|nr:YqgE/AlgH family protein [Deltaproteobacteria bacterium]